jgi:hypothetical protein
MVGTMAPKPSWLTATSTHIQMRMRRSDGMARRVPCGSHHQ